jgi:3-hydroxybutyrate dehydrogenase
MSDASLRGRCALITGSVHGLGLAAARRFAQAGCHVAMHGLAADDSVASLQSEIQESHRVRTTYAAVDLRDPAAIERMIASTLDAFGSIDILVNNAVVRHSSAIDDFSTRDWNDAIAVNLSAAFHTIRLTLPGMKRRNWGRIINVSSIYGLTGAPNRAGYVTTKTALIGLTRAVALETTGHDITCNAVCPGTAETPIHDSAVRALMAGEDLSRDEAERKFLSSKQPTGRFVSADGVAGLMLFLCTDGADITGAALPVDGGWSAQ